MSDKHISFIQDELKNYPINLQAKHISKFLGVGITTVYKIINDENFPKLTLPNTKIVIVPKNHFIAWYFENIQC